MESITKQSKKITSSSDAEVPSLQSNQEDADTHIIIQTVVAGDNRCDKIVVCSPDTCSRTSCAPSASYYIKGNIFLQRPYERKQTLVWYITVHNIYDALITTQRNILLSVHCMTGCDTVSSFFGHGKWTGLGILMQKVQRFWDLSSLGTIPVLTNNQ